MYFKDFVHGLGRPNGCFCLHNNARHEEASQEDGIDSRGGEKIPTARLVGGECHGHIKRCDGVGEVMSCMEMGNEGLMAL